jgi:hypothetical protein
MIGFLLPSLSALDRGSRVVHAAPLRTWWVEQHGFQMTYPEFTALCGVEGWGETKGPVTCKRCLRSLRGGGR